VSLGCWCVAKTDNSTATGLNASEGGVFSISLWGCFLGGRVCRVSGAEGADCGWWGERWCVVLLRAVRFGFDWCFNCSQDALLLWCGWLWGC